MTNIIVGNIVVGFISVILGNAGHALIHNKLAYSIVDVLVAIALITIYYFLGKYNYKVKVWQVIIIGVVNATIWWVTPCTGLNALVSMRYAWMPWRR